MQHGPTWARSSNIMTLLAWRPDPIIVPLGLRALCLALLPPSTLLLLPSVLCVEAMLLCLLLATRSLPDDGNGEGVGSERPKAPGRPWLRVSVGLSKR